MKKMSWYFQILAIALALVGCSRDEGQAPASNANGADHALKQESKAEKRLLKEYGSNDVLIVVGGNAARKSDFV